MALRTPRKPTKTPQVAVDPGDDDEEHPSIPGVVWLTPLEAWTDYDDLARSRMGMSGEEFGIRWDRGDFADEFDFPEAIYVSMMRCMKPPEATDRVSTAD
jgi:hypothetical protein